MISLTDAIELIENPSLMKDIQNFLQDVKYCSFFYKTKDGHDAQIFFGDWKASLVLNYGDDLDENSDWKVIKEVTLTKSDKQQLFESYINNGFETDLAIQMTKIFKEDLINLFDCPNYCDKIHIKDGRTQ